MWSFPAYLILFVFFLRQLSYWLYLWQIKEFRWDRMRAWTQDVGWRILWDPVFRRPQFSPRIFLISFVTLFYSIGLLFIAGFSWVGVLILILAAPMLATLGVIVTAPFSYWREKILVKKAVGILNSMPHLYVIGITGSCGKSSTKEFLAAFLASTYPVCKTPGNRNTLVGVAQTINLDLKANYKFFVVEMGAYRREEIEEICRLVKPRVGILTNIGNQHLALFGSRKNLIRAKLELFEGLPRDNGWAVLGEEVPEAITFLRRRKIPFRISSWSNNRLGKIIVHLDKQKVALRTQLLGKGAATNVATAALAAYKLGVPVEKIKEVASYFKAKEKTLTHGRGLGGAVIIDDSYSSSVSGFENALEVLQKIDAPKKMLITSGLIELGRFKKREEEKLLKKALSFCDQIVITSSHAFKTVRNPKLIHLLNPRQASFYLKEVLDQDWAVLLEGRLPVGVVKTLYDQG